MALRRVREGRVQSHPPERRPEPRESGSSVTRARAPRGPKGVGPRLRDPSSLASRGSGTSEGHGEQQTGSNPPARSSVRTDGRHLDRRQVRALRGERHRGRRTTALARGSLGRTRRSTAHSALVHVGFRRRVHPKGDVRCPGEIEPGFKQLRSFTSQHPSTRWLLTGASFARWQHRASERAAHGSERSWSRRREPSFPG